MRILCNVSQLKCDDYRLDNAMYSEKVCEKCDNFVLEDAYHIILQCEYTSEIRHKMFDEMNSMYNGAGRHIINESDDILATILGKICTTIDLRYFVDFCKIACTYVYKMYWLHVKARNGIG